MMEEVTTPFANVENDEQQLIDPIVINDGETVVVQDEIIAPVGQPAVNIPGDNAQLRVTSEGSISAPDSGNTAVLATGEDVNIQNRGQILGGLNGISSTSDDLELTNRGTIASDSRAVDLSNGDGSTVQNFGQIVGTGDQRNGALYVNGPVDDLTVK